MNKEKFDQNKKSLDQNKKILVSIISDCLLSEQPIRRSSSWYVVGNENLLVLNLQKSQWGSQYYVNIAAFLNREKIEAKFPPEFQGDIRFRLDQILGEHHQFQLKRALDFDNAIDKADRLGIFRSILLDVGLPIIRSMLTREGVINLKQNGILHGMVTSSNAAKFFALNGITHK